MYFKILSYNLGLSKSHKLSMLIVGQLARHAYEGMRQEASSVKIQKNFRMHIARKAYKELYASAISIQTGMRGMVARSELRFRRETKAAIVIQVGDLLKKAITTRCLYIHTISICLSIYIHIYMYTSLIGKLIHIL